MTPATAVIGSVADEGPKGAAIKLTGSGATFDGGGVSVNGSTVTIASPGSYSVSGKLDDGCIVVNTGEVKGDVTLTLAGADVMASAIPGAVHNEAAWEKRIPIFFDYLLRDEKEGKQ